MVALFVFTILIVATIGTGIYALVTESQFYGRVFITSALLSYIPGGIFLTCIVREMTKKSIFLL